MYLNIVEKGLELASNVLEFIRENDEKNREINERHHNYNIEANENIKNLIHESNDALSHQVGALSDKIIDKIELEKLEDLINKTESLELAIDMENMSLIHTILADLMSLSKYALSRVNENKEQWFMPWMQATSLSLLALGLNAKTAGAKKRLNEEVKNFRFEILDKLKPALLVEKDVPWLELSAFVRGENENILSILEGTPDIPIKSQELRDLEDISFGEFRFDPALGGYDIDEKRKIRDAEKISITEVFRGRGDKIEIGKTLFLIELEFDKVVVEYSLLSDFTGEINKLHVKKGQQLSFGDILLDYTF